MQIKSANLGQTRETWGVPDECGEAHAAIQQGSPDGWVLQQLGLPHMFPPQLAVPLNDLDLGLQILLHLQALAVRQELGHPTLPGHLQRRAELFIPTRAQAACLKVLQHKQGSPHLYRADASGTGTQQADRARQ